MVYYFIWDLLQDVYTAPETQELAIIIPISPHHTNINGSYKH